MSGKPLENHPPIDSLFRDLHGSDDEAVERAAFELVGRGADAALPIIIEKFLVSTGKLRNHLAVALGDARDERARAALVVALRDPATRGHRGSIVYALQEYSSDGILADLVNCVLDGSYEEAVHAVQIIEQTGAEALAAAPSELIQRLRKLATREGGWRRDAAAACLEDCSDELGIVHASFRAG